MITVLNDINPTTPLGKMMLAAIAAQDFSDDQFEKMLMDHEVLVDSENNDLSDLFKILNVVQVNRPELYEKLEETKRNTVTVQ